MKRIVFVCALSLMISLTGCVETIVMDPHEKDLPVMVNCIVNPDYAVQTLYLQYVKGKSAQQSVPIEAANVYLITSFSSRVDTLFFHHVAGNKWETSFDLNKTVHQGKCVLSVEIPGRDVIHAETTIPPKYRPEVVSDAKKDDLDYLMMAFGIFHGHEQIKTPPVYIIATKGRHDNNEAFDNYYPYIVTDHPYADNFNINGKLLSDLPIDGDPPGHEIAWRGFRNMCRLMPNLQQHDRFVRIECLDSTYYHILAGPLDAARYGLQDHFDFLFVSEEYDEYLRSVYIKDQTKEHDITNIYSTESVYSNIEGGVGIFGSYVGYDIVFMNYI